MSTRLDELILRLERLKKDREDRNSEHFDDHERSHVAADEALLWYIDDQRVKAIHDELATWFS